MDGCIYRTKDGECDLYSEGGKFKAFCDPEHCDNIAPSNADRIRAMTDEELAEWIADIADHGGGRCAPGCYDCTAKTCESAWLDWLREDARE